jgi:O-antigen/teichoic acid export membrane protein
MTGITGRVIGNTLWLLLQRVGGRLLTFILMVYLARCLGSLQFGKFTFATSFALLFITLSDLGITTLTIREVARNKAMGPQYVGGSATLKVGLSIFAFLIIAISLTIMNVPFDTKMAAYLIGACIIFRNMGGFFGAVFQAYEEMKYVTISEISQKILLLIVCLLLLHQGYGLISISLVYFFSGILYCLFNIGLVYWKFLKPRYRINTRFWGAQIKEALPLAFVAVISMVYYNIDIVMLGKMKGEEIAGWYGASYHLFFALTTFSGAFLSAAFPVMSRFFEEAEELLIKAYQKSFKVMIGVGIPVAVGGFLLAEKIILFLFGPQYQHSVPILKIFCFLIIFSYLNGLAGYFLTSTNRQRLTAKIIAVTTGINVSLNFILIPRYSYIGAAFATVASEVLFLVLFLATLPREFRYLPLKEIAKSLVSSAIMSIPIILMINYGFSLPVIIGIGAITYSLFVFITGYITEGEIAELQNTFLGRKTK